MKKTILLFGFSDMAGRAQASQLQSYVNDMAGRVRVEELSDYLKPIGILSDTLSPKEEERIRSQAGPFSLEYKGGELPVRIVVMAGFTDDEIDSLLKVYPKCGIRKNDLKAVLTPFNASWSAVRLCRQLQDEHRSIGG